MPKNNSFFDRRYFVYLLKRILPFFISSNIVMLISSFLIYMRKSSYIFLFGEVSDLSYGLLAFVYIYPVLLGIFIFRFLFSKKQSDFAGSLPINRSAIFCTGVLTGGIACFIPCLLMTFLAGVELHVFCGNNIYVIPEIYLITVLFWFIAYFSAFMLTCAAAFLSGTYVTHIILTAVFLLSPAVLELSVRIFTGGFFRKSTTILPSVCGIPYIFISDNKAGLNSVFGVIYGLVFAILLIFAGKFLFKKRKFEKAREPYVSRSVFDLVRFGIYLPACFVFVCGLGSGSSVFLFFFLILGVFLCEVLMNRGLRKEILKGAAVFGIAVVVSVLVYIGLWSGGLRYEGEVFFNNAEVVKMTAHIPKCGQLSFSNLNQETVSVEIPAGSRLFNLLKDRETFPGSGEMSLSFTAEIKTGKRTERSSFSKSLSSEEFSLLVEYLSADEEFKNDFYWRSFPEKPQEIIFMQDGVVLHGLPSEVFLAETTDFESDLAASLSEKGGSSFISRVNGRNSEQGLFGIYFVNGKYHVRRSALSGENLSRIYEYFNSEAEVSEKGRPYISSGKNTDLLYFTGSGYLPSEVVRSAVAKSKSADGAVTVKLPTYLNFYTAVFVDKTALQEAFADYYNKTLSALKNGEDLPSSVSLLGGIFEKKYSTEAFDLLSIGYDKESIGGFISAIIPYAEEFENIGDGEYYYISCFINGMPMNIYLPGTENVEKVLSKYLPSGNKITDRDVPQVTAMSVNGTQITDPDDISYILKGTGLKGSADSFYAVPEIKYSDGTAEKGGGILLTEKMIALLKNKYGITAEDEYSVVLTAEKRR